MTEKKEWKKVGFQGNEVFDFDGHTKGVSIEGIYLGVRDVPKTESVMHSIETESGVFDFWGSGQLNYLLAQVKVDQEIKVVYQGLVKVKVDIKGKKVSKEIHQYEVFTAE